LEEKVEKEEEERGMGRRRTLAWKMPFLVFVLPSDFLLELHLMQFDLLTDLWKIDLILFPVLRKEGSIADGIRI